MWVPLPEDQCALSVSLCQVGTVEVLILKGKPDERNKLFRAGPGIELGPLNPALHDNPMPSFLQKEQV